MDNKTEVVRLRITPELKRRLQEAAASENRTMSNYIENLIKKSFTKENAKMTKAYYFADETHADAIYGDQLPVCLDIIEVARLAREWDMTTEELLEQMHEASAAEIAEYGVYDSNEVLSVKTYGEDRTFLRLTDKAFTVYSDTDPLKIIEKYTNSGYRYDLEGCISDSNLTEAEVNELLEHLWDN